MPIEQYVSEHRFEPVVYYCGIDKNIPPGVKYGPATRDVFLVECCLKGYGKIIINNNEYPITPRSAYFLFPGDTVTHITDTEEPREGYWCAIEGLQVASSLKKAGITSTSPFAPPEAFDEIYAHVEALYMSRDETDLGADLRRTSHLYSILGALLRTGEVTDKNAWVQKAIGYMETNYPDDISVASLASEIGLDRCYFSTLFKSQTGVTPYAYLTYLRVKKAASLIKDGGYSMSEIAEAVGLVPQNFARIFRREIGISPREYKKEVENGSEVIDLYRRPRVTKSLPCKKASAE